MGSPPECWKGINSQQSRGGGRDWNNGMGTGAGGAWEGFEPGLVWDLGRSWDAVGLWRWDGVELGCSPSTKAFGKSWQGFVPKTVAVCGLGLGLSQGVMAVSGLGAPEFQTPASALAMAVLSWELRPWSWKGREGRKGRLEGRGSRHWDDPIYPNGKSQPKPTPTCGVSLFALAALE